MIGNEQYTLEFTEENKQITIELCSFSDEIRALEFLDFIVHDIALVKGDGHTARAVVSSGILRSVVLSEHMYNIEEYLQNKCDDYFAKVDVVVAREYAVDNRQKILKWPVYTKKNVNWAVVRSTDVMTPGKMFVIRTLENESGKEIIAADDVYIMIGCMGEIYDISLEKFLKTYELTEEPLDVFEQMMTYIPEIKDGVTGEYIAIDEAARICRPKSDTYIYVQKLNERTKIFNGDGTQGYFLGHKGDYMAARKDDLGDMYIINKDIFEKTYIRV